MQPTLTHVPPTTFDSISATRLPASVARMAAAKPLRHRATDRGGVVQRHCCGSGVLTRPPIRGRLAVEVEDVIAKRQPDVVGERPAGNEERNVNVASR